MSPKTIHDSEEIMEKEYDLSKLKRRRNPYSKYLKRQITIRIGNETINYFKKLSQETGISYQNLINSYLSDCAEHNRKPAMKWE
jgi:predicted DNA binding CopG/RHH family protein